MNFQTKLTSPFLKKFIDNGKVSYSDLIHTSWIDDLRKEIEEVNTDDMTYNEELSFWLNAYNLLVLKSVVDELRKNQSWNGPTSIFGKIKFFFFKWYKVANRRVCLYSLENRIIRKKFKDPRIHFALNCATNSCPYLPEAFFNANTIDEDLDKLSSSFINDQGGVEIQGDAVYLSRIFKWYKGDFGEKEDLIEFINSYLEGDSITDSTEIKYMDYDWSLNRAQTSE